MESYEFLMRGAVAGLAISAPVGPVNVMCVSRTISNGPRAGLISGLGAAAADTLYGAIAGFSISFVIGLLIRNEFWVRLVGGFLLIAIGIHYYFKRPVSPKNQPPEPAHSELVTAFLLNLTNPTTVLSFLAVLAGLGIRHPHEWWVTLMLVAGIFLGAMFWYTLLAFLANHFRERFDARGMLWMNRIAGFAIGGFGIVMLILAAHAPK